MTCTHWLIFAFCEVGVKGGAQSFCPKCLRQESAQGASLRECGFDIKFCPLVGSLMQPIRPVDKFIAHLHGRGTSSRSGPRCSSFAIWGHFFPLMPGSF